MNDICVILAHCNTVEKLEILKKSISYLKRQNKKILLIANFPVPFEIQFTVDFFLYKKENEIVLAKDYHLYNLNFSFWYRRFDLYFEIKPLFNHCYAVFCLMRQAIKFCKGNGYNVIHFINYDILIDDCNILNEANELLNGYDFVLYNFFDTMPVESIHTNFLSAKTDYLEIIFDSYKTVRDYFFNEWCQPVLEIVVYNLIKKYNFNSIVFTKNYIRNRLRNMDLVKVNKSDLFCSANNFELGLFEDEIKKSYFLIINDYNNLISIIKLDGSEKDFIKHQSLCMIFLSAPKDNYDIAIYEKSGFEHKFNFVEKYKRLISFSEFEPLNTKIKEHINAVVVN